MDISDIFVLEKKLIHIARLDGVFSERKYEEQSNMFPFDEIIIIIKYSHCFIDSFIANNCFSFLNLLLIKYVWKYISFLSFFTVSVSFICHSFGKNIG